MRFKVYTDDAHPLVLIRSSALTEIFDQDDLAMKQNPNKEIQNKYHEYWIHKDVFLVPSFFIKGKKAKVGMGRHRLTMLSRHMKEIPAAFEHRFSDSDNIEEMLKQIVVRNLTQYEVIEYPSLPIENLGEDINGEPMWKNYID